MDMTGGIISDILQYVKQNKVEKAQEILDQKLEEMQAAEVQGKRATIDEINMSLLKINIEIKKIANQYDLIKIYTHTPILESIERYTHQLKKQRAELEIEKKTLLSR